MKTFNQLREMARNIGNSSYSPLRNKNEREKEFNNTKDHPLHSFRVDQPSIKVHSLTNNNTTKITTNDHANHETLHRTIIEHKKPDDRLKFEHDTQNVVERHSTNKLPKHYASSIAIHHVNNSNKPLVSNSSQYLAGHKMWRHLVNHALNNNLHVYHHDGKVLHKTNNTNMNNHLENSFGKEPEFEHKHMIISKNPIKM